MSGTNLHELEFEAAGRHACGGTQHGELREMRERVRGGLLPGVSLQSTGEVMRQAAVQGLLTSNPHSKVAGACILTHLEVIVDGVEERGFADGRDAREAAAVGVAA